MATFAKQFSCFFLIVLSTCCQTHARESKFFSKYRHLSTNSYVTIPSTNPKVVPLSSPSPSPAPITSQISSVPASAPVSGSAPAPAPTTLDADYSPAPAPNLGADYGPTPAPAENEIPYYGLYAKDTNNEEEEFSGENPEELNKRDTYTYSNGYTSNNNAFWTSNQKSYYNTNNRYDFDSGYKSEPEGMSDTRLLNNGKYYYDVEHENYKPSGHQNNNEEGYNYGNYKKSKYEFNSMEEYEKQERYADVQQEFIP